MKDDLLPGEITSLLNDLQNPESLGKVITLAYEDLRKIAQNYFKRQDPNHTMQATALLHEVYIHILQSPTIVFENRQHFINSAALMMRQMLGKFARAKHGLKRGGDQKDLVFDEGLMASTLPDPAQVLLLEQALDRLEALDPRKARLAQMRLFLGLSVEEIAELLEVTDRTVRRDWQFVRTWLSRELSTFK